MHDDSMPVLIGAGQLTRRDVDPTESGSPVSMMANCAEQAAADAGLRREDLGCLDSIAVPNMMTWSYDNAPGLLAERLGAQPNECLYSTVGGNTPQWLVNKTAVKIEEGKVGFALLAGAEALRTLRRTGQQVSWETGGPGVHEEVGDPRPGTTPGEQAHGLFWPAEVYPLFENALRAHQNLSIEDHRNRLGVLCERLAAAAAKNPHAWFREPRSAAEITTVTAENRYVGFPYTKFMNAIIDVNQAAAVLMTSVGRARKMGVPESRWVYLLGGADAHDHWFISERANYHSSPAIRLVGERALAMAGLTIEEIDDFDLYSCFPCSVQIGCAMLGIAADDPRGLTVTGGLPYAGGPGNNYSTHAIAAMVAKLRERPGTTGLVSALGWYITKHSIGIYSTRPPTSPLVWPASGAIQAEIDSMPKPETTHQAHGAARIETYTVVHDREGQPALGIVVGRDEKNRRFVANTPKDRTLLEELESDEAIGRRGRASHKNGLNSFDPN